VGVGMSRWGIKMGLLVALTTLLIVATVNTVKAEETIVNFTDNNILVARLKIMDASYNETTKTINVSYKDTFKIKIEAINTSKAKDGKIDILIYRFADPKPIKVKEWNDMVVGKVITINTTEMKPALYYIMIRFIEKGPNNITTSKELISYKETDTNPKFNISITCKKPIIEKCKVKNQKESVTIGDNLVIDVTVWGTNEVEWYFKRWENYRGNSSYENLTWGKVTGNYNYVSKQIKVNTFELFNNSTLNAQPGEYEIVIKAGEAKYSLEV